MIHSRCCKRLISIWPGQVTHAHGGYPERQSPGSTQKCFCQFSLPDIDENTRQQANLLDYFSVQATRCLESGSAVYKVKRNPGHPLLCSKAKIVYAIVFSRHLFPELADYSEQPHRL